jgi:hypothetical protein
MFASILNVIKYSTKLCFGLNEVRYPLPLFLKGFNFFFFFFFLFFNTKLFLYFLMILLQIIYVFSKYNITYYILLSTKLLNFLILYAVGMYLCLANPILEID